MYYSVRSSSTACLPVLLLLSLAWSRGSGHAKGKVPALESLATLAFDYPPRASFFRHELTEFLQLTDEEGGMR